ncbi:Retrovirus-related Pol polyprotein from transposon RE1 [Forsythia ovata]|uniref:Retrovirus-related Pol polyprotein from transposon RE1 n=1 Tax=Forsythia ovata TaxID=205694 RepID=A0ABD1U762_9LAMI
MRPSPAPNSRHIPQSGSTSCIICTDPVDESLQATNSHTCPSPSHSDFRPASSEPITELPMIDHTPIAAAPLGFHPMLTQAKAGIFKTRHLAHLGLETDSFIWPKETLDLEAIEPTHLNIWSGHDLAAIDSRSVLKLLGLDSVNAFKYVFRSSG